MFAAVSWADEVSDRAAIALVIDALNDPAQRAGLFTQDADCPVDFDRLVDLHRNHCPSPAVLIRRDEKWSELTVPRVVSHAVRFVTPDVALVDGASIIRGAVSLKRCVPLLFVMRKERAEWRIRAVRVVEPA